VFDLNDVDGKKITVDPTQLGKAHVLVMGAEIPQSDANGWHMTTATRSSSWARPATPGASPRTRRSTFSSRARPSSVQ